METVTYMLNNYGNEIFLGISAFLLLLLALLIIQMVKVSRLTKRLKTIFKGENVSNVEEMLIEHKNKVDFIINSHTAIEHNIGRIEKDLSKAFAKSAIYKYDAFSGLAGKLSFVYVLLDSRNSGVILNGIFSNEGHYLYIKDVVDGKTEKELSKEEKGTLEKAISSLR